jgi:recombination protein RecT
MSSQQQITQQRSGPPTVQQKAASFRALLEREGMLQQIKQALPSHIKPEYMVRVVMTTLQKNPALLECNPQSILAAIIEASQLGLMPDGILGEGYLVPYKGACQFQAGYRGFISLARRSGQVAFVAAELVFHCDEFDVEFGTNRRLVHKPDFDNIERGTFDEFGELKGLRGAYAVVKYKDGEFDFEYMPLPLLNQIRNMSKAKNSQYSPWNTPEARPEMYRKIPIRRLAKRLPLSPEFQRLAAIDELRDFGVDTKPEIDAGLSSEMVAAATQSRMDDLAEKYASQDHGPTQEEPPIIDGNSGQAAGFPEAPANHSPAPAQSPGNEPFDPRAAVEKIVNHQQQTEGRNRRSHPRPSSTGEVAGVPGVFDRQE